MRLMGLTGECPVCLSQVRVASLARHFRQHRRRDRKRITPDQWAYAVEIERLFDESSAGS